MHTLFGLGAQEHRLSIGFEVDAYEFWLRHPVSHGYAIPKPRSQAPYGARYSYARNKTRTYDYVRIRMYGRDFSNLPKCCSWLPPAEGKQNILWYVTGRGHVASPERTRTGAKWPISMINSAHGTQIAIQTSQEDIGLYYKESMRSSPGILPDRARGASL
jgi:hypothetical protein